MRRLFAWLNLLAFIGFGLYVLSQGMADTPLWAGALVLAVLCLWLGNAILLRGGVEADWLSLYFRRKRLEESKRIEELERKS